MNEIVVNGKKYVKAIEIAKHLGYTGDYVGQLCRSGKVSAQKVGHSWYVEPNTLDKHKRSRHRVNKVKSRAALQPYRTTTPPRRVTKALVQKVVVQHYEADDTDLRPSPQKFTMPVVTSSEKTATTTPSIKATPATIATIKASPSTNTKHRPVPIKIANPRSPIPATTPKTVRQTRTVPIKKTTPASSRPVLNIDTQQRVDNKTRRLTLPSRRRPLRTFVAVSFFVSIGLFCAFLITVTTVVWDYRDGVVTNELLFEWANVREVLVTTGLWRSR